MELLKKSIIFTSPFSAAISNLKTKLLEISEKVSFEIHTLEDMSDIHQLVEACTPAIIISNCPTTCTLIFETFKDLVSTRELNVLLISEYSIPDSIIKKIKKFGPLNYLNQENDTDHMEKEIITILNSIPTQSEISEQSSEPKDNKEAINKILTLQPEVAFNQVIDYHKISKEFNLTFSEDKEEEPEGTKEEKSREEEVMCEEKLDETTKNLIEFEFENFPKIFSGDTRGTEIIIEVLRYFQDPEVEPNSILKYISDSIYDKTGGETYFSIDDSKNQSKEILQRWENITIPIWTSSSSTIENNIYIHPFYHDSKKIGHSVSTFENSLRPNQVDLVEAVIKSAKGIFLDTKLENQDNSKNNIKEAKTG